jgi:hypothetical protein
MSFESRPRFYRSDSSELGALGIGEKVSSWMYSAKQVSICGRRQVLEDGADVCNSKIDSENEDHGEVLTGMYTSKIPVDQEGNPLTGAYKLTPEQAAVLRIGSTIQPSAADHRSSPSMNTPVQKIADTRGLSDPSRFDGVGEPTQGKSGMTPRSQTKGANGTGESKVPEECEAGGTRVPQTVSFPKPES